jgi:hypothetical protein
LNHDKGRAMDDKHTLNLHFTEADRRQLRDEYEQSLCDVERRKVLEIVQAQLNVWQSMLNAILDLNNTLLVVSTLVLSDNWQPLRDERFIKEIGGSHQVIAELSKGLENSELINWKKHLQVTVNMYVTALRLYIQHDRKLGLQETVRQMGAKPIEMPILTVQGTVMPAVDSPSDSITPS